jgi:hypothetical protein
VLGRGLVRLVRWRRARFVGSCHRRDFACPEGPGVAKGERHSRHRGCGIPPMRSVILRNLAGAVLALGSWACGGSGDGPPSQSIATTLLSGSRQSLDGASTGASPSSRQR